MAKKTAGSRKSCTASGERPPSAASIRLAEPIAYKQFIHARPFTCRFGVDSRSLTVTRPPHHPSGQGQIPPDLASALLDVFLRQLGTFQRRPDVELLVIIAWYPPDSLTRFDLREVRICSTRAMLELQLGGLHQDVQAVDEFGGYYVSIIPSDSATFAAASRAAEPVQQEQHRSPPSQLVTPDSRTLIEDVRDLISRATPEEQCHLGEFIARQYERSTGQPAAFVTFATFFSEFAGVRGASKQLKRTRPAVTNYVKKGLLPAIRLDDKQYIFFKSHLDTFQPPKLGPRTPRKRKS